MNEGKREKIRRYTLLGYGYIATGAFSFIISQLTREFGLEWIHNWLLYWVLLSALLCFAAVVETLVKHLSQKKKKKETDEPKKEQAKKPRWGWARILFSVIVGGVGLFLVVAVVSLYFSQNPIARNRYIKSPDGENKAVIVSYNHEPSWAEAWSEKVFGNKGWTEEAYVDESIYPVRALLFYEEEKGVNISPEEFDVSLNWVDNHTLEITRTFKDGEWVSAENRGDELPTEYLRW